MKNFLKILGITTLAQMILWLLLIGGDYIQENISYNVGDRVYTFGIVVLPVIYAIIYIICYKNKTQKIKQSGLPLCLIMACLYCFPAVMMNLSTTLTLWPINRCSVLLAPDLFLKIWS